MWASIFTPALDPTNAGSKFNPEFLLFTVISGINSYLSLGKNYE